MSEKQFKKSPLLHTGTPVNHFGGKFTPVVGTGPLTGSADIFHGCSGSIVGTNSYEIYPHVAITGGVSGSIMSFEATPVTPNLGTIISVTDASPTKIAFKVTLSGSTATPLPTAVLFEGVSLPVWSR